MEIVLSEKQKQVVEYEGEFLSVIASAGSGKTRVLTKRIEKMAKSLKRGQKILAITFSNKAANELRERLEVSFNVEDINELMYIGTTHNFCLNIIKSYGNLIGLPEDLQIFDSDEDRIRLFTQAINNLAYWKEKFSSYDKNQRSQKIRDFYYSLSKKKRELKFAEDYRNKPHSEFLFKEYDELLIGNGAIDFDDIIRYAYKILASNSRVRDLYKRIYKHICVDEAQDLNKAQYEFIKIFSNQDIGITMVGDPKQAIYGFNGASDEYLMVKFIQDFPEVKKILMSENYRSSKAIIENAQKLNTTYKIEGVLQYEGEFKIKAFTNEEKEADWVIEHINYLLKNGHKDIEGKLITEDKICVLARNRYVFNTIIGKLSNLNFEFTLKSSIDGSIISETDFFKAFELGLKVIANSKDNLHFNDLIILLDLNKSPLDFNELKDIVDKKSEKFSILVDLWNHIVSTDDDVDFPEILSLLKSFIEKYTHNEDEKNMMINDYIEWETAWNVYVKKSSLGNRSIVNFLNSISLGELKVVVEKGITLSTVHMSKGLEYDVIVIMGLYEGGFPDYRSLEDKVKLEEEQHNMFVAITRSKRLCYLTYPETSTNKWGRVFHKEPSQFLEILGYNNECQ